MVATTRGIDSVCCSSFPAMDSSWLVMSCTVCAAGPPGLSIVSQPDCEIAHTLSDPLPSSRMTPDELLTTTRSVRRRLDFDRPVPKELLLECLEIAIQAPSGGNRQMWQWLIVTDEDKKRFIGDRYRRAWEAYNASGRLEYESGDPRREQLPRVQTSARYLAERMAEVPAMVIACIRGRVEEQASVNAAGLYGSIVPAVWSFMLAARVRGLGSAYTTLHLTYEEEIARELGIPYERYTQAALLPVAYYTGDSFRPVERVPLEQIVHWDRW